MSELFEQLPAGRKKFIEIGGFPGVYSTYFKKYRDYDVTLLDHIVLPEVIHKMESANGIPIGSINTLEADFFKHTLSEQYDVVFSLGFIEHFSDTVDALRRHYELLVAGGTMLVSVPNFRGLNGWLQNTFDPANYVAHNIDAMIPEKLSSIAQAVGLRDFQVFFYGKPVLWLESSAPVSRITRSTVNLASKVLSLVPLKNRLLSPFVVLTGRR